VRVCTRYRAWTNAEHGPGQALVRPGDSPEGTARSARRQADQVPSVIPTGRPGLRDELRPHPGTEVGCPGPGRAVSCGRHGPRAPGASRTGGRCDRGNVESRGHYEQCHGPEKDPQYPSLEVGSEHPGNASARHRPRSPGATAGDERALHRDRHRLRLVLRTRSFSPAPARGTGKTDRSTTGDGRLPRSPRPAGRGRLVTRHPPVSTGRPWAALVPLGDQQPPERSVVEGRPSAVAVPPGTNLFARAPPGCRRAGPSRTRVAPRPPHPACPAADPRRRNRSATTGLSGAVPARTPVGQVHAPGLREHDGGGHPAR